MCGISGTPGDCIIMYFIRRAWRRVPRLCQSADDKNILRGVGDKKKGHTRRPYKNYIKILASGPFSWCAQENMKATAAALHNFIALAGSCDEMEKYKRLRNFPHSTLCNLLGEFQINLTHYTLVPKRFFLAILCFETKPNPRANSLIENA